MIENSLGDPKMFWRNWKNCSEKFNSESHPTISGEKWHEHFSTLHKENSNTCLQGLDINDSSNESLNQPFSKEELLLIMKKTKKWQISRI